MAKTFSDFIADIEASGKMWLGVTLRGKASCTIEQHPFWSVYAILEGNAWLCEGNGAKQELRAGDVYLFGPGTSHSLCSGQDYTQASSSLSLVGAVDDLPRNAVVGRGPTAAVMLCGSVEIEWPIGLNEDRIPKILCISQADPIVSEQRIRTLNSFSDGVGAFTLLTQYVRLLLLAYLRTNTIFRLLYTLSNGRDPAIARSLQLMEEESMKEWTVETLAREVKMSRSGFAAKFYADVGRTPIEVLCERRMRHAAELLGQGTWKVKEVALMVGYHSDAAFTRRFKRHYGVPPAAFRPTS
ncbi:MAG TPA: AraC family transcriptional regulator [Sphingobium sp.]|uniref:AraC family transcriptional regulator n=1 Tax=Sphingobium sp. TaxID=1912891 RepID=UPI002ED4C72F